MKMKLRPQILVLVLALTVLGVVALYLNYEQVSLLAVGAMGPLGMKLLESE